MVREHPDSRQGVLKVVSLSSERFVDSGQFLVVCMLAERRTAKLLAPECH
jgi:hypothetical protein